MKGELITKFTEKLLQYAESAEMFASKNVPLYVEELLTYHFYDNILVVALLIVGCAVSGYFMMRNIDDALANGRSQSIAVVMVSGFTLAILSTALAIDGTERIRESIKIKTAPRVYVIDYLRGEK